MLPRAMRGAVSSQPFPRAACLGIVAALLCLATAFAADLAGSEKETCKRNLRIIHDAIQAYRLAKKELPNSLSDLVPGYLADGEILFCPAARKRALTSVATTGRSGFNDPKTSYFYEFSNVPLQEVAGRTNRDWKRAQMGMLGSVVPLVRCLLHDRPLNLSFGGDLYECDRLEWEYKFTNLVEFSHLAPEFLLAPTSAVRVIQIQPRDAGATAEQVDLTDYFNASLEKPWFPDQPAQHFARLKSGLLNLNGILFDVRGVVQLSGANSARADRTFPVRVDIPLQGPCHQLHFLMGANQSGKTGEQAGLLRIHQANGQVEQIALRLGIELGFSWDTPNTSPPPSIAKVVWRSPEAGVGQLFRLDWTNNTEVGIRSIECVGSSGPGNFFLVALTVSR